jgi:hypothetical protein
MSKKKNRYKTKVKRRGKQRSIKRRKDNKTLSQKSEKGAGEKNLTKDNKRTEPKIKVLAHE